MQQATDLVRQMVTRWGMSTASAQSPWRRATSPFLGGGGGLGFGPGKPYSEATAQLIDAEVRRILQEHYDDGCGCWASIAASSTAGGGAAGAETLEEEEILNVSGLPPAPRNPELALPVPVPTAAAAPSL